MQLLKTNCFDYRSKHNYLRITRMLKSLGELGFEHMKVPFVHFMILEAFQNNVLPECRESCMRYWVQVLRDENERFRLMTLAEKFY